MSAAEYDAMAHREASGCSHSITERCERCFCPCCSAPIIFVHSGAQEFSMYYSEWLRGEIAKQIAAGSSEGADERSTRDDSAFPTVPPPPTTDLIAEARAAVLAEFKLPHGPTKCSGECSRAWPCNTARLADALVEARRGYTAVVGAVQRFQPGGSPPPGDGELLVSWILRTLKESHDAELQSLRAELAEFQRTTSDTPQARTTG